MKRLCRPVLVCLGVVALSATCLWAGELRVVNTVVFQRAPEPREGAFTFLLPKGWTVEGGIMRVDPLAQGGAGNSIAAKLDMATKKDTQGTVMSRALPDTLFMDMTASPAGQMGLFPRGSNYNGMLVMPHMSALDFLTQVAFSYAHPQVSGAQVTEQRPLPEVAGKFLQRTRSMLGQYAATFSYDAALITVIYTENGVRYKEKLVGVVEDFGQLGAGLWGNKETGLIRAPVDEFERWEPIFSVMRRSVIVNPEWVRGELRGQLQRSQILINTQQEIQRIDREIVEHRQKTNDEINNDMFLTLTDQEEYVNPYTNEVEVGSNQWERRWQNEQGDVIYTDDANYDPNVDPNLNLSGFKQSAIRKRFPN